MTLHHMNWLKKPMTLATRSATTLSSIARATFHRTFILFFWGRSDWSRTFPERSEIFAYLSGLARKYGLYDKTRFNTEIKQAKYDDSRAKWQLETTSGAVLETDIVVTALGQLNRAKVPEIAGKDSFQGPIFHSAEWQHDVDLAGKRVAVIGNGPSAAQFIPEVAKIAGHLAVFQRSPCHVVPRNDEPYSALQKPCSNIFRAIANSPVTFTGRWSAISQRLTRLKTKFLVKAQMSNTITDQVESHFDEQVTDPHLRKILKPGARWSKRFFSNDYYPALQENVCGSRRHQTHQRIGIETNDGQQRLRRIWGTGFGSTEFLAPLKFGCKRHDLNTSWHQGAGAYLGITMLIPVSSCTRAQHQSWA